MYDVLFIMYQYALFITYYLLSPLLCFMCWLSFLIHYLLLTIYYVAFSIHHSLFSIYFSIYWYQVSYIICYVLAIIR